MAVKKIVFVLTSLRKGGAEGKAQKLITALSDHYKVELLLFNNAIEYDLPPNVHIQVLGSQTRFLSGTWLQLPHIFLSYFAYIKKDKTQASLSYGYMPNMLCLLSRRFGWKRKTIINHINNSELELKQSSRLKAKLMKTLISGHYQKADAIIVPSDGLKRDLIRHLGINGSKINLLYNPLDLSSIGKLSAKPLDLYLDDDASFIFLHVGNNRPQKNHRLLLESFAQLKADKVILWLIGIGADQNLLTEQAKELKIESKVRFFGAVDNPYQYMSKADCLVLCSDYEGLPNVILEALACKLPVISTDCNFGPREILAPKTDFKKITLDAVEIAEFGILTPVGNRPLLTEAMNMTIANPDLLAKIRSVSRQRSQDFDIEHMIKDYLELIN